MPTSETTLRPCRVWPWWRWGVMTLSALGLALSSYLSWHYLSNSAMFGCGGGSGCDEVLNSRWSSIAGVLPVSGLAAGAYLAMLVCSLSLGPASTAPVRRLAWNTLLVLASASAGSAVWFTIVQKWIVGAFCPYCLATHLVGLLLAVLVISRARLPLDDDLIPAASTDSNARGLRGAIARIAIGLSLAGILAAAQIFIAPPRYRGGESQRPLLAVDAHSVPLIGSPAARYVVTLFFDYKCPHCQQLHLMLNETIRRYNGQLAFALSPAPLNRACNPHVPRDAEEFNDSCALARLALAVWRADPKAFPVFENWMYSFDSGDRWRPRSLAAATAKAIELIGGAKFDVASKDPWIDRHLQESVQLYGATMQNGAGGVPKLVFGPRWVTPQPRNAADLISILQTSLGLPQP